ncbi:MAG: carboxypeptidase-like regulatory domain-containing protein, partial [Flavobacteriaceae bacterium]|nr:carboxypeptidase-like regulatory domain-containing protein [Flavobacteriaceae bacterium]
DIDNTLEEVVVVAGGIRANWQEETHPITIKGTVNDEDGLPLPAASIQIKGTEEGVITDFQGNYSIIVKNNDILVFNFVGYETLEVPVKNKKLLDVILKFSQLEEVIVTAQGITRELRVLGGAFGGYYTLEEKSSFFGRVWQTVKKPFVKIFKKKD